MKDVSDRNFSKKLDEIEESLASSGQMFLGGSQPSSEDAAAINEVRASRPDPRVYPNAYSWYSIVSKFSPEKQSSWK